jgi:hydroxymethylpyrimidine pyrophosphatase-like HAD family hydrolase
MGKGSLAQTVTVTSIRSADETGTTQPVLVADLLSSAETLTRRLQDALREEHWLDAYLFAAGLGQLAEDRVHADPFLLQRAASYLGGLPSRPSRLAATLADRIGAVTRAAPGPATRRLLRARQPLTELTLRLADQVLASPGMGEPGISALTALLRASLPAISSVPRDPMRVPACFYSFDQHPDDVRWLARAFRERYPALGKPLCIVGVRTSGSYLAPLHAAALRADGTSRVELLSYRPGRPFLRSERATLRGVSRAGGLVLVVDDPPGTGNSLAATARAIAAAGVPDSRIVFLLSLFGPSDELPDVLRSWPTVVQPWADWTVHGRIAAQPVRRALASLADPGIEVLAARPVGTPYRAGERGHMRARFAVRLSDHPAGTEVTKDILVEGAGLGYFGRQGVAIASALKDYVPHVYGFADGLLYRDWLPSAAVSAVAETRVADASVPGAVLADTAQADTTQADTVAAYVMARRQALPAPAASVSRLGGRDPVWEVAAKVLSGQFGGLALPARPLLLEPLVRWLLTHEYPTVLDSKTDLRHWLPDPAADGGLRKVDFYQRAFGHHDLTCYDPVFDLAGAAADPPTPLFEEKLRQAYQDISGEQVDGERWLLYRLAQLWRLDGAGDLSHFDVRQRSAAAVHDYLAVLYLRDLSPGQGPLCAIDLDGVLECDQLGFPATSPTGILALRALIAHGYRPVLATGRSLPEVRDRCLAFGLAGGVAEYGAVLYHDGAAVDLRPPESAAVLAQIRQELSRCPGVRVDPRYRYIVRASSDSGPLGAEVVAGIPALGNPDVRVIHGDDQTDITVAGVDKGSGFRALAALLSDPAFLSDPAALPDPGCALAVGDTPPDLPLLAFAQLARAPRNARLGSTGTGIKRTRHAYQAGLSDACADLLGHRPGRCEICRPHAFTPRTKALLAVLDLRANGLAAIPSGMATLGALAITRPRW